MCYVTHTITLWVFYKAVNTERVRTRHTRPPRRAPPRPARARTYTSYVENKAGLTGQTVPGRRIPGHWPTPVPEALAVAEPVTLVCDFR